MVVRIVALVMFVSGVLIAYGGAMEFRYFGPGTAQFTAGLWATPAGLPAAMGGVVAWGSRGGRRWLVGSCAVALLLGTAVATWLQVMGPSATLLGLLGGVPPLMIAMLRETGSAQRPQ